MITIFKILFFRKFQVAVYTFLGLVTFLGFSMVIHKIPKPEPNPEFMLSEEFQKDQEFIRNVINTSTSWVVKQGLDFTKISISWAANKGIEKTNLKVPVEKTGVVLQEANTFWKPAEVIREANEFWKPKEVWLDTKTYWTAKYKHYKGGKK